MRFNFNHQMVTPRNCLLLLIKGKSNGLMGFKRLDSHTTSFTVLPNTKSFYVFEGLPFGWPCDHLVVKTKTAPVPTIFQVYDSNSKQSFRDLTNIWYKEIERVYVYILSSCTQKLFFRSSAMIPILVVGVIMSHEIQESFERLPTKSKWVIK